MFTKVSAIAFFAGLAAAYHTPVGAAPSGNSITRPLLEVVPACKPFQIQWTPTTKNTVSLILLRGPSSNAVYLDTIVEKIPNSGSYSWTPKSSLEADTTHYGIELIDDITGQYQYSTQFGISKDACGKESSSPSASGSGYPVSTPAGPSSTPANSVYSSSVPTTTKVVVASTGYPVSNSTVITGTKPLTVPSSLKTSATATGAATGGNKPSTTPSSTPPASSGAASALSAGMGLAGAMAAAVFML